MSHTFDWSQLNRYGIASYVWIIADRVVGKNLTTQQFYRIMSTHLKKQIPLKFKTQIDNKVIRGWVYIGGFYYVDMDEQYQKSIKLVFQYKSRDDIIYITNKRFWKICLTIADTILHEIIHMRQYRRRNFQHFDGYISEAADPKLQQEQEYLGSPDEIDAYSFNIACELTEKFDGDRNKIIQYLDIDQKNLKNRSGCWKMYLKAFEHDHNHPVIQKLKRRIIYYLKAAQRGHPFVSSSWINY